MTRLCLGTNFARNWSVYRRSWASLKPIAVASASRHDAKRRTTLVAINLEIPVKGSDSGNFQPVGDRYQCRVGKIRREIRKSRHQLNATIEVLAVEVDYLQRACSNPAQKIQLRSSI